MSKWPTGKAEEKLVALREQQGLSVAEIAKKAGVSYSTASLHLTGIIPLKKMTDMLPTYPDEWVRIEGDCALTSDWHAPYFSMKWLKRLLGVCRQLEINQLAIVGDLTDLKWISRYVGKDSRGGLEQDLKIIYSLMQVLLRCFDRVYWSRGNHEDRLLVALQGHDIIPVLADMMTKEDGGELIHTAMPAMLLNSNWRLEHPRSYSRDATKVASQVANILRKNVACGHGHFIGYKHEASGKYVGLDLGGMFDVEKQEYLYMGGATTHPRWNPGFWIYRKGKPEPFDDALVNWDEWEIDNENNLTN